MNKRLLGIVAGIVLAGVGTFVLVSYVRSAENRALAGEERVEVLVVDNTVSSGEAADQIDDRVSSELVPAKVKAAGAVTDLDELAGTVAAVDLVPGEQLITDRFVTEETFAALGAIAVPEGLLEVTVSLAPHRALGGEIIPGDTVAFVASFDPFTVEDGLGETGSTAPEGSDEGTSQDPGGTRTSASTHIILNKMLVTNVQVERLPASGEEEDAEASGVGLAPTGNLLVTLAGTAAEVEEIVFTAEHGATWLARQPVEADEADTQIQTRGTIYR